MSSSLTSKPYQQLSRLLLISPNMCSNWSSTTSNRTRSSSAPPDRVLKHCALNSSLAIPTEKSPPLTGLCDTSNKFSTLPTPLPLADANSSEQQRFVLPFQKTSFLPNYICGSQKAAAVVPTTRGGMHRCLAHCLSTRSSSLLQLTPPNAHYFAIISSLPSVTQFHSTSGNGEQSQAETAQSEARTSSSTEAIQIPVTFDHGHFKLYFFDRYEAILHYWQPIDALFETLKLEILPNAKWERVGTNLKQVQKFRIYNQEEIKEPSSSSSDSSSYSSSASSDTNPAIANSSVKSVPSSLPAQHFRLAPTMPFGYLFVALNPSRVQLNGYSSEKGQSPVIFQFKLNAETLKRIVEWSEKNSLVSSAVSGASSSSSMVPAKAATFAKHELLFLEQEKYNLRAKFEPMQIEFNRLVSYAKIDAHRRFKLGGLFLLSAQLGFVGRLTWFEYSWDIMEPVTFCLTYSMMVATFAYYIITSEEYVLPAVERRMVIKKFWKLVKSENFDVRQYRMMRDELTSLEKQIRALRKENFV